MTEKVPPGKLRSVITYLEMRKPPARTSLRPHAAQLALMRAERPTLSFYRYLYETVGERWLWWERRAMDDETLAAIVRDPAVEIYVLYVAGVPAGFAELDRREKPDIALAYLGLVPEFIGEGYGRYLLTWAIDAAWHYRPRRLLVNTCTFDHPRALRAYQRAGFEPYGQEVEVIDDPREAGLIPPHVPLPG